MIDLQSDFGINRRIVSMFQNGRHMFDKSTKDDHGERYIYLIKHRCYVLKCWGAPQSIKILETGLVYAENEKELFYIFSFFRHLISKGCIVCNCLVAWSFFSLFMYLLLIVWIWVDFTVWISWAALDGGCYCSSLIVGFILVFAGLPLSIFGLYQASYWAFWVNYLCYFMF